MIYTINVVNTPEDLRIKPGLNINPPPEDGRCERCGKHISEVKPYKNGVLLVKNFREVCDSGCISASWECSECISEDD
ncbi:MAG: hypothetical protein ACLP2P_12140 [Desulfobaccales bacterium]